MHKCAAGLLVSALPSPKTASPPDTANDVPYMPFQALAVGPGLKGQTSQFFSKAKLH
jgi:hypothetical protein